MSIQVTSASLTKLHAAIAETLVEALTEERGELSVAIANMVADPQPDDADTIRRPIEDIAELLAGMAVLLLKAPAQRKRGR
jgi:hypothetical protein